MKRIFSSALLVTLLAPAAFAQDFNAVDATAVDMNQQSESQHEMKVDVGDIIKRIIVGAIDAGVLDRETGRDGYRRTITCYAQNRRGEVFRAIGTRPQVVQQRAVDQCYSASRFCRPLGCEAARGGRDDRRDDGRGGRDDRRDDRRGPR